MSHDIVVLHSTLGVTYRRRIDAIRWAPGPVAQARVDVDFASQSLG